MTDEELLDNYPTHFVPPEIGPVLGTRTREQAHELFGWVMTVKPARIATIAKFVGVSLERDISDLIDRIDEVLPSFFPNHSGPVVDGELEPSDFYFRASFDMGLVLGEALIAADSNNEWTVSKADRRMMEHGKHVVRNLETGQEANVGQLARVCASTWSTGKGASLAEVAQIWAAKLKRPVFRAAARNKVDSHR